MCNSLTWKGTSLKISDTEANEDFIYYLNQEGISLRNDEGYYTLENQANYFILEDDFVFQSKNLSLLIDKYTHKNYNDKIFVYSSQNQSFQEINEVLSDKEKYLRILENNILDGDKRNIDLSVNTLNLVLEDNTKNKTFIDALILLCLANKSSYDAENIKSEFQIEEKSFTVNLNIASTEPIGLYPIYSWIINDEEYKSSHFVKLEIVRQIIVNKRDITNVESLLIDSKLAYKRIISRKTNDYFEQLNRLKDDFLTLSKNENSILRTLNLTFFTWIGYLGIELFKIITEYNGQNVIDYLLFSKGTKKGIVILMFIIALFFIFLAYILEIKSLEKSYYVIKEIYENKILFESDADENSKFESTIKKPKIGKLQIVVFIIIIIVLIFRFLFTFHWK
ncbi:MAG TPA: hypothetical protein GXZ23_07705 [Clostridiales bacterium]|nr:hypothetical protein [Clostridiales bacterium]